MNLLIISLLISCVLGQEFSPEYHRKGWRHLFKREVVKNEEIVSTEVPLMEISKTDPVEYFSKYNAKDETKEERETFAHPNKILAKALENLLKSLGDDLQEIDVLACLSNIEVCYADGNVDQINFLAPLRQEETFELIDAEPAATCGDIVSVDPFEVVRIKLISNSSTECNIFLKTNQVGGKRYYLDFMEQPQLSFKNCSDEYLKILQKTNYLKKDDFISRVYSQTYCGAKFILSEFPTDSSYALFTYKHEGPENKSVILTIRSSEMEVPRQVYTSAYPRIHYSDVYYVHPSVSRTSSEIITYDPKLAQFQECPLECGRVNVRWDLLPDRNNPPKEVIDPIDEANYPWYVVVVVEDYASVRKYGGSIVNSQTILTAASFLQNLYDKKVSIHVRPYSEFLNSEIEWQTVEIHDIITHPTFKVLQEEDEKFQKYRHDIAIIQLKKPLKLGLEASPVCFAPPNDYYGNLVQTFRPITRDSKTYLTEAFSVLWSKDICYRNQSVSAAQEVLCHSYHDHFDIEENPGSPVMLRMKNNWFQIGILSQSFESSTIATYMRYSTNLFHYYEFIKDFTVSANDEHDDLCI